MIYGCRCSLSLCRTTVAAEPGAQDAPKDVATVGAPSFIASLVVVVLAATDGGVLPFRAGADVSTV